MTRVIPVTPWSVRILERGMRSPMDGFVHQNFFCQNLLKLLYPRYATQVIPGDSGELAEAELQLTGNCVREATIHKSVLYFNFSKFKFLKFSVLLHG